MTFYQFVTKFKKENLTYAKDLAGDVGTEEKKLANTYKAWQAYLASVGACPEAQDTLKRLWKAYTLIVK